MNEACFINLSNHPSAGWKDEQVCRAQEYGTIIDMEFPNVPAGASEEEITLLADEYVEKIVVLNPAAVMCQGEHTFVYTLVRRLIEQGIVCVAACSERRVQEHMDENGNTQKESIFEFVRFRRYH